MTHEEDNSRFTDLRRRALDFLQGTKAEETGQLSLEESQRLVHELNTHQIELELQKDDLENALGALEVSRKRYTDLYDFAPVGYLTISEKGLILEANLRAAEMLGQPRANLLSKPLSTSIHREDQDVFYQHRRRLLASGDRQIDELRLKAESSTVVTVLLESVVHPELDGSSGQYRVVLRDIDKQVATEAALHESIMDVQVARDALLVSNRELLAAEKLLRGVSRIRGIFLTKTDEELFSAVLEVILTATGSRVGTFGYLNKNGDLVVTFMGAEEGDCRDGAGKSRIFPQESWGNSALAQAIREKCPKRVNVPTRSLPDGQLTTYRHISQPLLHQGEVIGLFQVANKESDYTDEDMAYLAELAKITAPPLDALLKNAAAERERDRLLAAFQQVGEAIVITDTAGRIEYVNPAFVDYTGYTVGEALGNTLRIINSGKQEAVFYKELWETISAGYTWQGRLVNRRKDGSLYTEEQTISPVFASSGEIINYVAVKHDITEHLKLAAQLEQAKKMESLGRIAGGVAHDFNNMLNIILGYTEMIMDGLEPGSGTYEDLKEISEAGRRSAGVVKQLMGFAREQANVPVVLDVNVTITRIIKMLQRLVGEDINLVWLPGEKLPQVLLDPSQMDQILTNLLVNARDALADTGEVVIETKAVSLDDMACAALPGSVPGDYLRLTVSDNGCGIDKDELLLIFEPFYTSKQLGKGTGLGLATVYGIVQQNNGYINVESAPGAGTTFEIYLPSHSEAAVNTTEIDASIEPFMGDGEVILVVEDDATIIKLAARMLTSLDYTVLTAQTAQQALTTWEKEGDTITLLLCDVIMPDMNGKVLSEKLLTLSPHLKILFMSGYTADVIAKRGVIDKGAHFIQKPFSKIGLATAIHRVLGGLPDR